MDDAELEEWERAAVELAGLAGAEIAPALGGAPLAVEYKEPGRGDLPPRDPVSEVDRRVEELLRNEVVRRHPEHGFLGEEGVGPPGAEEGEPVWAVDPVDGTSNLVSGFPLVCASVAVLARGEPVAGALWCSATPRLRPGVYHARRGGALRFDGEPLRPREHPGPRALVALPGGTPFREAGFDARSTGSAALDCAFVAAGLLAAARLKPLFPWDVAAGVVLVRAAGGEAWVEEDGAWRPFDRFQAEPTLRAWRRPMVLGTPAAAKAVTEPTRSVPDPT